MGNEDKLTLEEILKLCEKCPRWIDDGRFIKGVSKDAIIQIENTTKMFSEDKSAYVLVIANIPNAFNLFVNQGHPVPQNCSTLLGSYFSPKHSYSLFEKYLIKSQKQKERGSREKSLDANEIKKDYLNKIRKKLKYDS